MQFKICRKEIKITTIITKSNRKYHRGQVQLQDKEK